MLIEIAIDQDQNLTTLIVDGVIDAEEMHLALQRMYAHGPTPFILWDMSKYDLSMISPDELHNLTRKAAQPGVERE